MKLISYFLGCGMIMFLLFACGEEPVYTPKPRAYPKVIYPERTYQAFAEDYCKFSFQYPKYAMIQQDTVFFDEKPIDACWFDVFVPNFNARIHCSYIPIDKKNSFEKLRDDAFNMANEHIVKANAIDELPIKNPNGVSGFAFEFEGATATPFTFFLTDSTQHYLRGSLYFYTKSRPDSLAPVIQFLKEDVMEMINTFAWKE